MDRSGSGRRGKRENLEPFVWVDDPGSREQKVIRWHGPAVTSLGGRRQGRSPVGEKANPKRGHGERSGDTDEPSVKWTRRVDGGTSLVAAITVSGRHALLVGYQPDEALRPSLATLFLSLPFAPSVPPSFFLSPSFEISSSHAVASRGTGVYRRNFIPTRARLSALAQADGLLEKSRTNASDFANYSLSRDTDPHFLHAFDTVDTG